jgi:RimJ/RimL family protein N-acetyltransferase
MQTNQPPDSWHENLIRLRPLCLEDLEAIQASVVEPAIEQEADEGQPDESPATSASRQTELEEVLRNANKGGRGVWAIETGEGQVVGAIATIGCHRRRGTFKFSLALLPPHRRQGYGREAVYRVLHLYFCEKHYQKVTVSLPSCDEPAIRFLKALGFHGEGHLRRVILLQGRFYDKLYYGMTAEEFERWERYEGIRRRQRSGERP